MQKFIIMKLKILIFLISIVVQIKYLDADKFQDTLGHLRSTTSAKVQEIAARDVAKRLLGDKVNFFKFSVDPDLLFLNKDTFKIIKNDFGKIEITASSGVAATWGLHYYLKHYCNAHISWEGTQIKLNDTLPSVAISIIANDRFRYYQNVCTVGYSSVWWQFDQWEKNIDWMALNGINLVLAFSGQEAIWERVYLNFNLTVQEINEHFGGPAFLPWSRMGNIRGWGGPLSSEWHQNEIALQHRILKRMRDLGIISVLPAFAGHVPRAFARLFPKANMSRTPVWNNFKDEYCCPYILSPTDPLFPVIGIKFLEMYVDEFGTDHVYNCDPFNENKPTNTDVEYLGNVSYAIYSTIKIVDPSAVWLLQGWFFEHDISFWSELRVKSFLTSVPIGRMIVLDLQSEQFPQYIRLNSYYGQPFIWCMLHNFGGTLGMFGSSEIINERVIQARDMENSTMIGTGLTPEGINQNYVIYELMNEMAYRNKSVNLDKWFQNYSMRRYGSWNQDTADAWKILGRTIYNFMGLERIRGHYVITRRPSLKILPWTWYHRETFYSTWYTFLQARNVYRNNSLYIHDVVDITRQALQLIADSIYLKITNSFQTKDVNSLNFYSTCLLALFDDLENILSSENHFLLGKWLESAKAKSFTRADLINFEYNARNQITLWGPNGEIEGYANKQWSGIVIDYFKPRWNIFLTALKKSLDDKTGLNTSEINRRIFYEIEQPFTFSTKNYPIQGKGNSINIAVDIFSKWIEQMAHF